MGGKASRNKGARGERSLALALTQQGWSNAHRIPLSGAMKGYKGDVLARYPAHANDTNFECKVRGGAPFNSIYALLYGTPYSSEFPLNSRAFHSPDLGEVIISGTALKTLETSGVYFSLPCKEEERAVKKIFGLKKMLGTSDILAIKQDRKGFIYIRFV